MATVGDYLSRLIQSLQPGEPAVYKFKTRVNGCSLEFDTLIQKYVIRKDNQIVGREKRLRDAIEKAKAR